MIASTSEDRTVRVWDIMTGGCRYTLDGHSKEVWFAAFSRDDKLIASTSSDGTIRIWDAATGACRTTVDIGLRSGRRRPISFSRDGSHVNCDGGQINTGYTCQDCPAESTLPGLSVRRDWIYCGGERILWVPPEFRPSSVFINGDHIVLGNGVGDLTSLSISRSYSKFAS